MLNGDNNSHTLFIVNTAIDEPMDSDMPIYESYDLSDIGENLIPNDYEGYMSVTLAESGDVIDVEVSFHVTTDGLVDVERI